MLEAAAMGVVEGVTEFIPVSSTGHLIVFGNLLNFHGLSASFFEIFIQLGAIFAVVLLYRQRFFALFSFRQGEGFSGIRGLKLLAIKFFIRLVSRYTLEPFGWYRILIGPVIFWFMK